MVVDEALLDLEAKEQQMRGQVRVQKVAHYRENVLKNWEGTLLSTHWIDDVPESEVPESEQWQSADSNTMVEVNVTFYPYRMED